jgi:hypothetical protein
VLTLGKLRSKARRRLAVLGAEALGPPTLAPCYGPGSCTSCTACDRRSPLSGATWGALRRAARPESSSTRADCTPLLEEQREADARAWIRRRDWQIMQAVKLAASWEAEAREAADRQLVADVAARRRAEAAA